MPNNEICRLLRDKRCRQAAVTIYRAAARVDAERAAVVSCRDRARKLKAAVKEHPILSDYFTDRFIDHSQPEKWAQIHAQLGELLQQYFPELLRK